ncbi:unnamed protein product, partial [Urochloa humidicola]
QTQKPVPPSHPLTSSPALERFLPQKSNLEFLSRSRPAPKYPSTSIGRADPKYPLLVLEVQIPQELD